MLTRKLFVIAILGLSVAFSSVAFGQNTTKKKRAKAKPKATATTNSSQRNNSGTNTPGTPAGTPKPVIGDTLDGVGIRSNGGGQGQTPTNLPNPNALPNGTVQKGASIQAMDPLVKLKGTQSNSAGQSGQTSRESLTNPPGQGQTNNILPYIEPANLKNPNTPSQTTVTGQNAASPTTTPANPKPKKKTKRKH